MGLQRKNQNCPDLKQFDWEIEEIFSKTAKQTNKINGVPPQKQKPVRKCAFKKEPIWCTWVAESVKPLTLGFCSGRDLVIS